MGFWDDVVRNFTGGGDKKPKAQPKPQPSRQSGNVVPNRGQSFSSAVKEQKQANQGQRFLDQQSANRSARNSYTPQGKNYNQPYKYYGDSPAELKKSWDRDTASDKPKQEQPDFWSQLGKTIGDAFKTPVSAPQAMGATAPLIQPLAADRSVTRDDLKAAGAGGMGMSRGGGAPASVSGLDDNGDGKSKILGAMSVWDKFVYGQNEGAQKRWAAEHPGWEADYDKETAAEQATKDEKTARNEARADAIAENKAEPLGVSIPREFNNLMNTKVGPSGKEMEDFWANTEGQNQSPLVYDKETKTWTLESPLGNVESRDRKQKETVETIKTDQAMEEGTSAFQKVGEREVYRLSNEEWAQLDPEQQQGIIANYALYEASLRDKEQAISFTDDTVDKDYEKQVEAIFGEKGGSKYYAPETVRVLNELGYTDVDNNDLDNFLNGSAIMSYEDILGQTPEGEGTGRKSTFAKLQQSAAFDAPEIGDLLSKGTDLLSAVNSSGQFSNATLDLLGWSNTENESVAGQIDPQQQEALRTLLGDATNKDYWNQMQNDPEAANEIQAEWDSATAGLDQNTVAKFMLELYDANDLTGVEGYMTRDEFIQNWLEKKS